MTPEQRLAEIAFIIESVDGRAMACDGPVTPTLQEMTQKEMSEIYRLATGCTKRGKAKIGLREQAFYWLLRLYDVRYRQGWEKGWTEDEVRERIRRFVISEGYLPDFDLDKPEDDERYLHQNTKTLYRHAKAAKLTEEL